MNKYTEQEIEEHTRRMNLIAYIQKYICKPCKRKQHQCKCCLYKAIIDRLLED